MIFIPVAMFVALLGWLLRKFGPSKVSKEPGAMKDIFWTTTGITGFTLLFTAFLSIMVGVSESRINTPAITSLKELKTNSRYIIIKAKVSEDTEEKSRHSKFAAYYDRRAVGQRNLTITLEGGNALVWNGDYETVFWKRRVDMATTLPALNKHELIVVGGRVTSPPSVDYKITQIKADFVLSGDLLDYKWHIRSGRVYPGLLAILIALYGLGNLIYAFTGLKKLRIDTNNKQTSKEDN